MWYLLQDPASSRVHRFTPAARLIIALMDGKHSVEELWELANKHLGEDAPTQDEMIQLLGQLHAADLLESDVTPDVAELFARGEREERARYFRSYANPMAIRIPLWDPDAFLNRFKGLLRLIWSRWGALVWLRGGAAGIVSHLAALAGAEQQLQRPRAGGRQSVRALPGLSGDQGAARARPRDGDQGRRRRGARSGDHPAGPAAGAVCRGLGGDGLQVEISGAPSSVLPAWPSNCLSRRLPSTCGC